MGIGDYFNLFMFVLWALCVGLLVGLAVGTASFEFYKAITGEPKPSHSFKIVMATFSVVIGLAGSVAHWCCWVWFWVVIYALALIAQILCVTCYSLVLGLYSCVFWLNGLGRSLIYYHWEEKALAVISLVAIIMLSVVSLISWLADRARTKKSDEN